MEPDYRVVRVAVLGIGNELGGDDAAGLLVARALQEKFSTRSDTKEIISGFHHAIQQDREFLIIEAGPVPENFTGPLRRFQPQLVILVDAADMGKDAGTWEWLDWRVFDGFAGSTHLFPLSVFAQYLEQELSCRVACIGIQPAQLEFGKPVSTSILDGVEAIAQDLLRKIKG